jgi:DHA1 family bicyclomycin/chloramphenicol resistance-like MFS transporter
MDVKQKRSEFLALMAAATAVTAIAIDAMLPALDEVREHFGLQDTPAATAAIVSVFLGAMGLGQMIYGPLSDRFGRKPILTFGLILYVVSGIAATFAPSFGALLAARFVWGLGSAAPRIVSRAILRDRFSGDALARALAIVVSIFLIAPTLAPLIGQAVLSLGSWRYTFAVGPVFAILVLLWSSRLEETLDPQDRRSIAPRRIASAIWTILRTPSALGSAIALTALTTAFIPYLASSERMFGMIYDRGDEFFLWFALTAAVMSGFTFLAAQIVKKIGTERTIRGWLITLLATSAVFVVVALSADGVPGFYVFYLMTLAVVAADTSVVPLLTATALEDVGHIAGTAVSTIGALSLFGGSVLSGFIDQAIDDTVTPFAVGYLVAAIVAIVSVTWARRAQSSAQMVQS